MTPMRQSGFTLVEVLMALAIFAMIAGIMYAALGSAGNGFQILQQTREAVTEAQWLGQRLRMDADYAGPSEDKSLIPLQITEDMRGDHAFDQLTLLVYEPGRPEPSLVRYMIDEQQGVLVRESRPVLAREGVEPQIWPLGKATSFDVAVMDQQGQWQQRWQAGNPFAWPKALRVHVVRDNGERTWLLPLWPGQTIAAASAAGAMP